VKKIFLLPLFLLAASLKPTGYLNDFAGLLTPSQKDEIEKKLVDIEKETTNEISVVIINSLEGKTIEEYANEIFNGWGIGKKGKDNGVLILISLNEKKVRIEVGYGLEGYLPDSICGRIIRDIMVPEFRKNDFYKGIKEAIETIDNILKGEKIEIESSQSHPPMGFLFFWYLFCIIFGLFSLGLIGFFLEIFVISLLLTVLFLNRQTPFFEFIFMLSLLIPFLLSFLLMVFASVYINILEVKLKKYYGKNWKKHMPSYLKNYVMMSGSHYSSGGGFSGSFGGFGGGCSGGGGASGGW